MSSYGIGVGALTIFKMMRQQKYMEEFDLTFCNEATKYEIVAKIGQGSYG
jgi:hypothetical protein